MAYHSHLPPGHEPGPHTKDTVIGRFRRRELDSVTMSVAGSEHRRGGSVPVSLRSGLGGSLDGIRIGLLCEERFWHGGGEGRTLTTEVTWEQWSRAGEGFSYDVELPIPADVPYSYEGTTFAFWWSVIADRRGRFGTGRCRQTAIWVAP